MDNVCCVDELGSKDSTNETQLQTCGYVSEPNTKQKSHRFDFSEANSEQKSTSHRKFFSGEQVLLIVAVAIFATLATVFMAMYFTDEGRRKIWICQNSNTANMKAESRGDDVEKKCKPCDCQNMQENIRNTSSNHTKEKCKPCDYQKILAKRKPCVCQNCSLVTNSSASKTDSTENGQCPVGCTNSTERKIIEQKCKPCVCQNCSLVTNCSKSKINSTENGQCPVGCLRNSTIGKVKATVLNHTDCADLHKQGERIDGVYTIDPDGLGAFEVRCDMTTSGGGWTVFQRRMDGSVDFFRGWADYKKGFGNPNGEFWLGLDKINRLSKGGQNVLRVDLENFENETRYANYSIFTVSNETNSYRLTVGNYSGNAGDSLSYHNRMKFSTKDRDNDQSNNRNCALKYKGAWWFNGCHDSNLNGRYLHGSSAPDEDGLIWHGWKGYRYSVKKTEMKIRLRSF